MKILLVSATASEIRPFINGLTPLNGLKGPIRNFKSESTFVDILVTGIGMIPTAFCLGKFLPGGNYDMAINAGICGSCKNDLVPGNVVEVTEDFPVELGTDEDGKFRDIFAAGLAKADAWPFQEGRLRNIFPVSHPATDHLRKVKGSTVGTLRNNDEERRRIAGAYDPDIETMEGASFLYSCLVEKIPNSQVRAVSNFVGETDRSKWQIELAVERLNVLIGELVKCKV